MGKQLSGISIFFPSLNDAKILPYLILKTHQAASTLARRFEIIVIDDGSTDDTRYILSQLMKQLPFLRVVRHEKTLGYGAAVRDGISQAKYEWIFYTDGDGQYDPEELRKLVRMTGKSVDVVNGYKLNRADSPLRRYIGRIYNYYSHREYALPIRDVQCDFRLMRSRFAKQLSLSSVSGLICLELVLKLQAAGARFAEVGVHHYPRRFGRSQFFRPMNLVRTGMEHAGLLIGKIFRR